MKEEEVEEACPISRGTCGFLFPCTWLGRLAEQVPKITDLREASDYGTRCLQKVMQAQWLWLTCSVDFFLLKKKVGLIRAQMKNENNNPQAFSKWPW